MSTGPQLRQKAGISSASLSLLALLRNEKFLFLYSAVFFLWNIFFVAITWKCHLLTLCISHNAGKIMEHGDRVHRVLVLHHKCHRFSEHNNINTEFWNEIFILTIKMISQISCLKENCSICDKARRKEISIKFTHRLHSQLHFCSYCLYLSLSVSISQLNRDEEVSDFDGHILRSFCSLAGSWKETHCM